MSLLDIRDLKITLAGQPSGHELVKGVSFDIAAGETLALVGESGSGKSLTALSIMRLLPERLMRVSGSISLEGRDLLSEPEQAMQRIRGNRIGMIFQEPMTSLNPVHTVGRQIAEVLKLHEGLGEAAAMHKAEELMDRVRIPSARTRLKDFPHQFSGGMRQRVMIAMALACRPKLLIADEPTTALDVTIQAEILAILRTLQKEEDMGILFITHDMGVVAQIAHRTLIMHRGTVVERGETADIFATPREPYTRMLLSAIPAIGSMASEARPRAFEVVDLATGQPEHIPQSRETAAYDRPPLLSVRNVSVRFPVKGGALRRLVGHVHAVENVSFDLFSGETLAIVGESGSGKSTTGRLLMRLTRPDSGDIQLGDASVGEHRGEAVRNWRRRIQMIFQDPFASLNPRIRVANAIAEPMLVNRMKDGLAIRARVDQLLGQVGLEPEMGRRFPHEFSGGQRQRICIARALALEPDVIVADEAVSALDVTIKARTLNIMMDLQQRLGLSYVFISHDMAAVERISHRVAVMYLGEIVEIGPRAAIFSKPAHAYTRRLIDAVPVPDPRHKMPPIDLGRGENLSTFRPLGYTHPPRQYREVSPGHFVQAET